VSIFWVKARVFWGLRGSFSPSVGITLLETPIHVWTMQPLQIYIYIYIYYTYYIYILYIHIYILYIHIYTSSSPPDSRSRIDSPTDGPIQSIFSLRPQPTREQGRSPSVINLWPRLSPVTSPQIHDTRHGNHMEDLRETERNRESERNREKQRESSSTRDMKKRNTQIHHVETHRDIVVT
jgi:hypothetical protein